MSGYILTCKAPDAVAAMDGALFTPDLDVDSFTEWFDIEQSNEDSLTLRNLPPLDNLGARMTGGKLIIDGDAGAQLGYRMRRGVIHVTGSAGPRPGYRMRAGTIVIARGPYDHPGLEMRRGTIVCLDPAASLDTGPAFAKDGTFDAAAAPATSLVMRSLSATAPARWNLYSGDRFEMNRGELWQPAR